MLRKIASLVFIILIICLCFSNSSYAMENITQSAEDFLGKRDTTIKTLDLGGLIRTSNYLYNVLVTIGIVISFAIGLIIGIQFILGSAEDQAKVKETLVPYVVGVFVIFAAFTIWRIVIELGNDSSPTPTGSAPYVMGKAAICRKCNHILTTEEEKDRTCKNCGRDGDLVFVEAPRCGNCKALIRPKEWNQYKCDDCGITIKHEDVEYSW